MGHCESDTHVPAPVNDQPRAATETGPKQEHDDAIPESWLDLLSSHDALRDPHNPSDTYELLFRYFNPITDEPTSQSPLDTSSGGVEDFLRSLGIEKQNDLATTNSASDPQPTATRSSIPSLPQGNVSEESSSKLNDPSPKAGHAPKHCGDSAELSANLPSYVSRPADGEPRETAANATDQFASDEYWGSLFELDVPTRYHASNEEPIPVSTPTRNAPLFNEAHFQEQGEREVAFPLAQDSLYSQWDPNPSLLGSSYPPMPLWASVTPMPSQPPTPVTDGSPAPSSASQTAYHAYDARDGSLYTTPPHSRASTPSFISHPRPMGPLNDRTRSTKLPMSIPISEPRPSLPATANAHPTAHLPTPRSSITPSPSLTSGYSTGAIIPPPQVATSREGTPRLAQASCYPNPSAPVPKASSTWSRPVKTPPPSARIIASSGKRIQVSQPVVGPYAKRNQLPRQQRPLPRPRSPGPTIYPPGELPEYAAHSMDQGSRVPLEQAKAPEFGNNVRKRKTRVDIDAPVTSRSLKKHMTSAETSKGHAEAPVASSSRMESSAIGSPSTSETTEKQLLPDGSEKTYPPAKSTYCCLFFHGRGLECTQAFASPEAVRDHIGDKHDGQKGRTKHCIWKGCTDNDGAGYAGLAGLKRHILHSHLGVPRRK